MPCVDGELNASGHLAHVGASRTGRRYNKISPKFQHLDGTGPKLISIEIIRERLKTCRYKSINEFDDDMQLMFSSWRKINSKDHKYFRTFTSLVDRFTK